MTERVHSPPIRVLLVDDHSMVAQAFRMLLEREPDIRVVGVARSVAEARAIIEAEPPTVLVVDYHLQDGDAIDLLGLVGPETATVVVTGSASPAALVRSVEAGVHGFLRKSAAADRLVAAVRGAASGDESVMDPEALRDLVEQQVAMRQVGRVSERELEVLRCLARGLHVSDVAGELSLSVHTVRNHVSALLDKLDVRSQLQAVVVGLRLGLLTEVDLR